MNVYHRAGLSIVRVRLSGAGEASTVTRKRCDTGGGQGGMATQTYPTPPTANGRQNLDIHANSLKELQLSTRSLTSRKSFNLISQLTLQHM